MTNKEILKAESEKRRRDKAEKRERIEKWIRDNAGASDADAARAMGVTRNEARRVRLAMEVANAPA